MKDPEDDTKEMPVLIIDTEGLGATDEEANHDTKIFMLALLLCSLLIFNSQGTIDENALSNLSLVVNLANSLKFSTHGGAGDSEELAKQFPSFLWVLRDFSLQLIDEHKEPIRPKDYLENTLKEVYSTKPQVEEKNRIRKIVKHFFKERDCCTLVRPMENEKDLQNLNDTEDSLIRPKFLEQLHELSTKVFRKVKPKKMNNQYLNGSMLIELAKAYVEALNTGKMPTIESAWDYMCGEENQKAMKASIHYIQSKIDKISERLPIDSSDLNKFEENLTAESENIFFQNIMSGIQKEEEKQLLSKIKKFMGETFEKLHKRNTSACMEFVTKFFDQNFKNIVRQNLRNENYTTIEDYEKDLEVFKEDFRRNFKGAHFEKCLEQILQKFNEKVGKDITAVKTRKLELELTAYKERMKRAEQELVTGKEDLLHEKERLNKRIQDLENERVQNLSQNEILNEKLKYSQRDKDEKLEMLQAK